MGAETAATSVKKNSVQELLNLKRHTDHKILGVSYVLVFTITLYYLLTEPNYDDINFWLHCSTSIVGCLVNASALRNFRFLSKSAENPGMFAQNRTFSYAFIQENMWFQVLIGLSFAFGHPKSGEYVQKDLQILLVFLVFVLREFVPKTSYTSWQVGNEKVNSRVNRWVDFINIQVRIVRWNYVFKKTILLYLFVTIEAEWFFGLPTGTLVNAFDRKVYFLLSLDAMHNITTAFFLQTLKFKGFISAETFSFLFNASPFLGVIVTYQFLMAHTFCWPYLIATFTELFINIYLVYPSKLSAEWKNRCLVALKASTLSAATYYLYATKAF